MLCGLALLATCMSAQEVPPTFFGLQTHNRTDWPSVQFGGMRVATCDPSCAIWSGVETSRGVYNWTAVDDWINLAEQNGVDILYPLNSTPRWASSQPNLTSCSDGPGACAPPTNMQDWDDWVTAVVTRSAGRIKYWELWNEVNTPNYWVGDIPTMVTMAQHAYRIIKSIDPTAQVLSPSVLYDTSGWLSNYLAAGGSNYSDIIGFHGYGSGVHPEGDTAYAVGIYKQAMTANGQGSKPLWDTESSWGVNSTLPNSDDQVASVARDYLLHWSLGVTRFYWYAWDDTGWGTLWDPANGIHPVGTAYKQVHDWMVGATLTAPCSQASNGTWTCAFTRPGGYQALTVWNPVQQVRFSPPAQFKSYWNISGDRGAIGGAINVGARPVLLESTKPGYMAQRSPQTDH
jgi:polysaccharide biosynthesis protein PslG